MVVSKVAEVFSLVDIAAVTPATQTNVTRSSVWRLVRRFWLVAMAAATFVEIHVCARHVLLRSHASSTKLMISLRSMLRVVGASLNPTRIAHGPNLILATHVAHCRRYSMSEGNSLNLRHSISERKQGLSYSNGVSLQISPPKHSGQCCRPFPTRNIENDQPSLYRPSTSSPVSTPGRANRWIDFDAEKADKEMAVQRKIDEASFVKLQPSQLVYHETYRPTTTENGVRIKGKPSHHILSRVSNDNPFHESVTGDETPSDPFGDMGEAFSEMKVSPNPSAKSKLKPKPTSKTDQMLDLEDLIEL